MPAGDKRSSLIPKAVKAKDRHHRFGSILLGLSITFAIEGCLNTWMRTGRLFATPHLFAGAGVAVLFSLSAAMVPFMTKQGYVMRHHFFHGFRFDAKPFRFLDGNFFPMFIPFHSRMQGFSPARWLHMIFNFGIVALFTWQFFTGLAPKPPVPPLPLRHAAFLPVS